MYFGVIKLGGNSTHYCLFSITYLAYYIPISIKQSATMAAVASRSKTDWAEDEEMEGKQYRKTRKVDVKLTK